MEIDLWNFEKYAHREIQLSILKFEIELPPKKNLHGCLVGPGSRLVRVKSQTLYFSVPVFLFVQAHGHGHPLRKGRG